MPVREPFGVEGQRGAVQHVHRIRHRGSGGTERVDRHESAAAVRPLAVARPAGGRRHEFPLAGDHAAGVEQCR
jgi:hypothetical protein